MNDTPTIGYAQEFRPSIWHRLGFRGCYVAPWDESDDVKYMVSDVFIKFDWLDRLRLLLTGRVHVFVRTKTENDAGAVESRSNVSVMPPGREERAEVML